jgi:hypothetical protein
MPRGPRSTPLSSRACSYFCEGPLLALARILCSIPTYQLVLLDGSDEHAAARRTDNCDRILGKRFWDLLGPQRPRISREASESILRMSRENRSWRYDRIAGALPSWGWERIQNALDHRYACGNHKHLLEPSAWLSISGRIRCRLTITMGNTDCSSRKPYRIMDKCAAINHSFLRVSSGPAVCFSRAPFPRTREHISSTTGRGCSSTSSARYNNEERFSQDRGTGYTRDERNECEHDRHPRVHAVPTSC